MCTSDDGSDSDTDSDVLDDIAFEKRLANNKRGDRKAILAEHSRDPSEWNPRVHEKTPEQRSAIMDAISKCILFDALDSEHLESVIDAAEGPHEVHPGTEVIKQGEIVGSNEPALYLLEKGVLDVFKYRDEPRGCTRVFTYNKAGQSFGELAVLHNCPRAATVRAAKESVLWSLDRETFNHCVRGAHARMRSRREKFLESVELLQHLGREERVGLVDVLQVRSFELGDVIIRKGDIGDEFFILEKGCAVASVSGNKVKVYGIGDYFGELALLKSQPRAADVIAEATPTTVLVLDGSSFTRLLGPLSEMLEGRAKAYSSLACIDENKKQGPPAQDDAAQHSCLDSLHGETVETNDAALAPFPTLPTLFASPKEEQHNALRSQTQPEVAREASLESSSEVAPAPVSVEVAPASISAPLPTPTLPTLLVPLASEAHALETLSHDQQRTSSQKSFVPEEHLRSQTQPEVAREASLESSSEVAPAPVSVEVAQAWISAPLPAPTLPTFPAPPASEQQKASEEQKASNTSPTLPTLFISPKEEKLNALEKLPHDQQRTSSRKSFVPAEHLRSQTQPEVAREEQKASKTFPQDHQTMLMTTSQRKPRLSESEALTVLQCFANGGTCLTDGKAHLSNHQWRRDEAVVALSRQVAASCCLQSVDGLAAVASEVAVSLRHRRVNVRRAAARLLEFLGKHAAPVRTQVAGALHDKDVAVRCWALRALARLGRIAKDQEGKMLDALRDPDAAVRCLAIGALGRLGGKTARRAGALAGDLVERLQDDDVEVRRAAGFAFAQLGSKGSVHASKVAAAMRSDTDVEVRRLTASALERFGEKAGAQSSELVAALRDEDVEVRRWAARALEHVAAMELGSALAKHAREIAVSVADPDKAVRTWTLLALGRLRHRAACCVPQVTRALGDQDLSVRCVAIGVLSQFGNERACWLASAHSRVLVEAMRSDIAEVRRCAALALAMLNDKAVEPCTQKFARFLHDPDPAVRRGVAVALESGSTVASGNIRSSQESNAIKPYDLNRIREDCEAQLVAIAEIRELINSRSEDDLDSIRRAGEAQMVAIAEIRELINSPSEDDLDSIRGVGEAQMAEIAELREMISNMSQD
eukprot:TRINITY_DN1160_c0_g1_i1.p1 TRINITY_DN1160_c0_g1~~TRINITY_DN1160_c0_g1_i1.p1  ORF type:complete len:1106 (+),score=219.63 TRINITY_DN1160_c0_g1_i1:87-3404(+)